MTKEIIHLEGIVLHSPDIDRLRLFYESLLGAEFKEERHGNGPKHYSCKYGRDGFLELYPTLSEHALPQSHMDFSSPSLVFRIPDLSEVKARKGQFFWRALTQLHQNLYLCHDSNGRAIYLHQDQAVREISLEEVVLHSRKVRETKLFYQSLFNLEPERVSNNKEGRVSDANGYIFRLPKGKIEISPSRREVPASPTLLFSSSHLSKVRKRTNGEISERTSEETGNDPVYQQEIVLHDPERRNIRVYGNPKRSWL